MNEEFEKFVDETKANFLLTVDELLLTSILSAKTKTNFDNLISAYDQMKERLKQNDKK